MDKVPLILGVFTVLFFLASALSTTGTESSTTTNITIINAAPVAGPEVNISPSPVDLVSCSTRVVQCLMNFTDANGYDNVSDIIEGRLYANTSTYASGDAQDTHYTNSSCRLLGGGNAGVALCNFTVEYDADNNTWNCTILITDNGTFYNSTGDVQFNQLEGLSLTNTPVMWNSSGVGVSKFAAQENKGNPLTTTNCGNVPLDYWVKGSNLTGLIDPSELITVGNITVDDEGERDEETETENDELNLTGAYQAYSPDAGFIDENGGTATYDTYHWINIPAVLKAQAYNGTYGSCVRIYETATCTA